MNYNVVIQLNLLIHELLLLLQCRIYNYQNYVHQNVLHIGTLGH